MVEVVEVVEVEVERCICRGILPTCIPTKLHLVAVAVPVPFPVLDETSAAMSMVETQNWQDAREATLKDAYELCQRAVEVAAKQGVPKERIWFRV